MRKRWLLQAIFGLVLGFVAFGVWLSPRVKSWEPAELEISPHQTIIVNFHSSVSAASVKSHIYIDPPINGSLIVDRQRVMFRPDRPLAYDSEFTVRLTIGLRGVNGLPLLQNVVRSFRVRRPRLVYISNEVGDPNLWLQDSSGDSRQLSDEPLGVTDFQVLPDGSGIILSSPSSGSGTDLVRIDLQGHRFLLLECQESHCISPHRQPVGDLLAYEKQSSAGGGDAAEVWLLDVVTGENRPAIEVGLLADAGYPTLSSRAPEWSSDGRYLALFKPDARAILVFDMDGGTPTVVPANMEIMGSWSPADHRLVFTELTFGIANPQDQFGDEDIEASHARPSLYQHVVVADLGLAETVDLSEGLEYDEGRPVWHPDGNQLAVSRTSTGSGRQIWLIPLSNGQAKALTDDPTHNHTSPVWSPDGQQLAFMRLPISETANPSIWIMDMTTNGVQKVADNAFLPSWLP